MLFHDVLSNILQTIGEGYALQKQDILCRQAYHHDVPDDAEFLTRSYFRYFEGREFTEIRTFLILTQEAQKNQFIQYDPKRWLDFHSKVSKTDDILTESISGTESSARRKSASTVTVSWHSSSGTDRSQ